MTDEVNLDIERESRTGLSEAVFSEGKKRHPVAGYL